MELSDVATPRPASADETGPGAAGRRPPQEAAQPRPGAEGRVGDVVPVVPGVRPEPSPWVVVTELTVAGADRVVIALVGEIDLANTGYLRAELAYLIDSGRTDIVADLTRTVSISSSGLGILVGALKTARRVGGRLELVVAADRLLKILRITRLDRVFTIHPTLDEALRH
jgi:anti-sigma B factor antagonist